MVTGKKSPRQLIPEEGAVKQLAMMSTTRPSQERAKTGRSSCGRRLTGSSGESGGGRGVTASQTELKKKGRRSQVGGGAGQKGTGVRDEE